MTETELAQMRAVADLQSQIDKENADKAKEIADARIAQEKAVADAKIGFAQASLGAVQTLAEIVERKGGQAAMAAFRVAQGSAAAQIAVNTIVAASKALAELGPIAGPFAAAGLAVTGATQEAAVWAQSPPQVAYAGVLMPPTPDATPTFLHPKEAVLNRQGRAALGDDTIRDANRGRAPAMSAPTSLRLDGREIGASDARQIRHGGKLADEIRRNVGRLGRM